MFEAKILKSSKNPYEETITTVELTYPRCIHSEFMTHRMFSRNSASSRAIPVKKMMKDVADHPFVPIHWGKNQKGMQAAAVLDEDEEFICRQLWLKQRRDALDVVAGLMEVGLHKQIANRLLEPWMWITVIATGSGSAFENFFKLRCHKDAEPHIQKIAYLLRDAYDKREITSLDWGDYHLPLTGFTGDKNLNWDELKKVSTARCARVSYLTHAGHRDVQADLELHDRLASAGHWSPFEHVARGRVCGRRR